MTGPADHDPRTRPGWAGRLVLRYRADAGGRTVAHDRHEGPLRVLKPLYPEGAGICHHVLVHPPGGIVGGDRLRIEIDVEAGAHALVTTPGATRFYRSAGPLAAQEAHLHVHIGGRLEWLPLETLAYPGCAAANHLTLALDGDAEMIGWDILALGLPASERPFDQGSFDQRLAMPGAWIEGGRIDAADTRLLRSPMGFGGREVLATAWFASGMPLKPERAEALVDSARAVDVPVVDGLETGVTSPHERVIVARALSHRVESAMTWLARVRAAWRSTAWRLAAAPPRVWRT